MQPDHSPRTAQDVAETAGRNGLVNAYLRNISVADAEDMLAQVWRRVEQYSIELPDVRFYFGKDGRIDIEFSFNNPAMAALILGSMFPSAPHSTGKKSGRRTLKAPSAQKSRHAQG